MALKLNPGKSHHSVETFGKWWDFSFCSIREVVVLRYKKKCGWQPVTVGYAVFRFDEEKQRFMVSDYPNSSVAFTEAKKVCVMLAIMR